MIKMEILNMMVILLMIKEKEMENIIMKVAIIILDNLKMDQDMVKVQNIMQMEILNMMVILLMIKEKEMENIIMKVAIIILDNLKMD